MKVHIARNIMIKWQGSRLYGVCIQLMHDKKKQKRGIKYYATDER